MKQKSCLYPHLGLTLEAFGEVRLCTSAMDVEFDLREDTVNLKEMLNHPQIQEHRDSFERGLLPETCRSCKKVEEKGVKSKREIFNEKRISKYGSSRIEEIIENKIKKPLHLSIGFSNHCNLKCSMCSSKYSSLWLADEVAFNNQSYEKITSYGDFQLNPKNLDELLEVSEECSDIFIKGGEPLFSAEALTFLNRVKASSKSPHIFIQTNGTILNNEIKKLIEELNIEIGVSIDGVGATYEWIRGFPYSKIIENINTFSQLDTDHKLSLDYTSSIFNLASLPETFRSFSLLMKENPRISHLSVFSIARQTRNSLLSLPLSFREDILTELRNLNDFSIEAFDVLAQTLKSKQLSLEDQIKTREWVLFLEKTRGSIPARDNESFSQWIKEMIV